MWKQKGEESLVAFLSDGQLPGQQSKNQIATYLEVDLC